LLEITTQELPKRRANRKKPSQRPTAQPPAVEEITPKTPFDEEEPSKPVKELLAQHLDRPDVQPWPKIGVWKAGRPKSEQKIPYTKGFSYWNETLEAAQRIFGTWYAYRQWPVMKLQLRGNKLVNPNCAKFSSDDGPLTPELIWGQLRMGGYLLRLLQRQTDPVGQVFMCEIELKGSGNWDENEMPVLPEVPAGENPLDLVDWDHPSNAEYKRVCISRGMLKLNQNQTTAEGADEMAAQEVLGDITKTLLQDRIEGGRRNGEQQQQPAAQDTASAAIGVKALEMLERKMTQDTPPAQQGTVKEQLEGLVQLALTMTPKPADMAPLIASQERYTALVEKMMANELARAQEEARKAKEEAQQFKDALPKPLTVPEQFAQLEAASQTYERITGRGKRRAAAEEDEDKPADPMSAAGLLGSLVGAAPFVIALVDRALTGYAMLRGQPAPVFAPLPGQPAAQPGPPAGHPDNLVQMPPRAGEPPADSQEPEMSPEEQLQEAQLRMLASLLAPMLTAFEQRKTGGEFARFVHENYGKASFDLIVTFGRQKILDQLSAYPEVWAHIGPRIQDFTKFMEEFFAYKPAPVQ
jgi:hypothetical protein